MTILQNGLEQFRHALLEMIECVIIIHRCNATGLLQMMYVSRLLWNTCSITSCNNWMQYSYSKSCPSLAPKGNIVQVSSESFNSISRYPTSVLHHQYGFCHATLKESGANQLIWGVLYAFRTMSFHHRGGLPLQQFQQHSATSAVSWKGIESWKLQVLSLKLPWLQNYHLRQWWKNSCALIAVRELN